MKSLRIPIEQYVTERLEDQINYYSDAATAAKRKYQRTKAAEIILAASVPLFSAMITPSNANDLKLVVGVIGVAISLISGLLMLYKFDENWVTYRTTAEALKSEKYLFLTQSGPYRDGQAHSLFIERIEQILGDEHSKWQQYILRQVDEPEPAYSAGDANENTQQGAQDANPASGADQSKAQPPVA